MKNKKKQTQINTIYIVLYENLYIMAVKYLNAAYTHYYWSNSLFYSNPNFYQFTIRG